jgi:glutamyl-tRNA reductase
VSAIYSLVRDWASTHQTLIVKEDEILPQVRASYIVILRTRPSSFVVNVQLIIDIAIPQVLARGFTLDQLRECIQEYEMINIWTHSAASREIRFMSYA